LTKFHGTVSALGKSTAPLRLLGRVPKSYCAEQKGLIFWYIIIIYFTFNETISPTYYLFNLNKIYFASPPMGAGANASDRSNRSKAGLSCRTLH